MTLVKQILAKNPKGRPEDVIADEIERDVTFVHLIATLSKNMDVPTPEAVLSAYKKLEVEGKLHSGTFHENPLPPL